MRHRELATTLRELYTVGRNVCIESAPGSGKTSVVRQLAADLGVPYVEVHIPTAKVEDFGIPWPSEADQRFEFKLPHWFPLKGQAPEGGVLCFDDSNQGDASLQKVLSNIMQARTLNGHELADGWMVVRTGNRREDGAGVGKVLTHMRDRETLLNLDVHIDDYSDWGAANGVAPECLAFARFRPSLMSAFDPKATVSPTLRSWTEGVFALLGKVSPENEFEIFSGSVGEGAAAEYTGFLRVYRNLPSRDEILTNPDRAPVPTDPATSYATAGMLATDLQVHEMAALKTYLDRFPAQEFSALTLTLALRSADEERRLELQQTPEFVSWAVANQDLLF